jgi:hypothetical protein
MADLLYDIAMAVYDELGALKGGTATGGSTTTVIDSALGGTDDDRIGGIVMVVKDSAGAGGAPESEFGKVTDYTTSTGTITLAPALSVAAASGDQYAVTNNDYPFEDMLRIINRTLRWLGPLPAWDDTSLDTAAGTLEYTLPAVAKEDLRQVWLGYSDGSWMEVSNWRVEPHGTAGTQATLIFRNQPDTGCNIGLLYLTDHTKLWLDSDKLLEYVPINRIVPEVALRVLRWKMGQQSGSDDLMIAHMNYLEREVEIARKRYPIMLPQTPHKSFWVTDPSKRGNKYGPWVVS